MTKFIVRHFEPIFYGSAGGFGACLYCGDFGACIVYIIISLVVLFIKCKKDA